MGEKEFRYVVRIADTDVSGNKTVEYSLRQIKGIGTRTARAIAYIAGVDPNAKIGYLPEEDIEKLRECVANFQKLAPSWMLNSRKDFYTGEDKHVVSSDWVIKVREDIELMKRIRCYRGIRHELGYKVRGQRTRSTGRRGPVVGVVRKKVKEAAAKKEEKK